MYQYSSPPPACPRLNSFLLLRAAKFSFRLTMRRLEDRLEFVNPASRRAIARLSHRSILRERVRAISATVSSRSSKSPRMEEERRARLSWPRTVPSWPSVNVLSSPTRLVLRACPSFCACFNGTFLETGGAMNRKASGAFSTSDKARPVSAGRGSIAVAAVCSRNAKR